MLKRTSFHSHKQISTFPNLPKATYPKISNLCQIFMDLAGIKPNCLGSVVIEMIFCQMQMMSLAGVE